MISRTSPSNVERPDFRLLPEETVRYLRSEFEEESASWLLKEIPSKKERDAVKEPRHVAHVRYLLRGLANRVASLLL